QLAVTALPPHPQPQLRSRLIDLVAIDPIAGPSQDFGELALSLQPESVAFNPALRIPRFTALRPNSCPAPEVISQGDVFLTTPRYNGGGISRWWLGTFG